MKSKELLYDERNMTSKRLRQALKFYDTNFRLSKLPIIRKLHPFYNPKSTNISWIPINKDIERPDEIALPTSIAEYFIRKAKHRVIVNFCACRKAYKCKGYPKEIGCLMLGESALEIASNFRREVDVDEALEHLHRGVDAGLIPLIGKARVDNSVFMVRDKKKLFTICLCCECCCLTRSFRHLPIKTHEKIFPRIEGLKIEVTDDCTGCGKCVKHCYLEAIKIVDGRAVRSDACRLCGRCVSVCPNNAVRLTLDHPRYEEEVIKRIEAFVDVT